MRSRRRCVAVTGASSSWVRRRRGCVAVVDVSRSWMRHGRGCVAVVDASLSRIVAGCVVPVGECVVESER